MPMVAASAKALRRFDSVSVISWSDVSKTFIAPITSSRSRNGTAWTTWKPLWRAIGAKRGHRASADASCWFKTGSPMRAASKHGPSSSCTSKSSVSRMRSVDEAMTCSPRGPVRTNPTSAAPRSSTQRSASIERNSMRSKLATRVSASSTKVRASHSSRLSKLHAPDSSGQSSRGLGSQYLSGQALLGSGPEGIRLTAPRNAADQPRRRWPPRRSGDRWRRRWHGA